MKLYRNIDLRMTMTSDAHTVFENLLIISEFDQHELVRLWYGGFWFELYPKYICYLRKILQPYLKD